MGDSVQPVSAPTPGTSAASAGASTARIAIPAEEFALAEVFERAPNARIDCEPAVASAPDHALLVVHAPEADRGTVETAIESEQGVTTAEFLAERQDGWAYRVTWDERPHRLIQHLIAADVTILSLQGQGGQWTFRLLAPDREGISRAHERMDDLDCGAECLRISTLDDGGADGSTLTHNQREALVAAFEAGYYDIPRDVTADELADELGISHQALSERFRRGYRQLIEDELAVDGTRP